jgi:hypothetical protein
MFPSEKVQFLHMDLDSDPAIQINEDPDPQPCYRQDEDDPF